MKLREATTGMVSVLKNRKSTDQERTQAQLKYREAHLRYSVVRFDIYLIQRRAVYDAIATLLKGTTWSFVSDGISEEAAAFHRQLSASNEQLAQSVVLRQLQLTEEEYKNRTEGQAWCHLTGMAYGATPDPDSSRCNNIAFDVDRVGNKGGGIQRPLDMTNVSGIAASMRRLTGITMDFMEDGGEAVPSSSSTTTPVSGAKRTTAPPATAPAQTPAPAGEGDDVQEGDDQGDCTWVSCPHGVFLAPCVWSRIFYPSVSRAIHLQPGVDIPRETGAGDHDGRPGPVVERADKAFTP